jgi:hypothetical protein
MSSLSRFMAAARTILDEKDRAAAPKPQPPFFVRTTWLFAELEELGLPNEPNIFAALKVARFRNNVAGVVPLLNLIEANTATVADGRKRHERKQLCGWIKEQIEREPQP